MRKIYLLLVLATLWVPLSVTAGDVIATDAKTPDVEATIQLPSGNAIVSQRYPANGPYLALWFTGQFGRVESEQKAAARLAELGVETWVTDWFAPLFLPLLPSSIAAVPDSDLADWLEAVRREHPDKHLVLLAAGHAAAWPLRAVRAWRSRYGNAEGSKPAREPIVGSLLLHPVLYKDLEPGDEPHYNPLAALTKLDTVLVQPMSSAGFWWRDRLKEVLESAGSHVQLDILPGVRDGFYRRGDATPREQAEGARLGDILFQSLQRLTELAKP